MKYLLGLIIFVLLSTKFIHAQSNEILDNIVLLNQKDFVLDESFPYYFDQIIVVQNEKNVLGKDINFGNYLFDQNIEIALSEFFNTKIPYSEDKIPLIIKVNRLTLFGESNFLTVDLSLTFYKKSNNSFIEILQTASNSSLVWNDFFNIRERKRGEVLLNAFHTCFSDLQKRFESESLRSRSVQIENLNNVTPLDEINFPIISTVTKPAKGLFYNFSDFIDLNLDTSVNFYLVGNVSKRSDLKYVFSKPIESNIWGGFDGENYFMRIKDRFFKLEIIEDEIFVIFNHADLRSLEIDHGFYLGQVGYSLSISEKSKKPLNFYARIDWYSGSFLRKFNGFAIVNSSNKKMEDLTFFLDGKKMGCLKQGEYFLIDYAPPMGMKLLEIRSKDFYEKVWFNPMKETMIRVKLNQNRIKVLDRIFSTEENMRLYLNGKVKIPHEDQ